VGGTNTGLPIAGTGGETGNGAPGTGGEGVGDAPQISLLDFDFQFLGNGLYLSGSNNPGSNNNLIENTITNPSITSTYLQVNVTANVPVGEYVP
jgi:hypothetical protein